MKERLPRRALWFWIALTVVSALGFALLACFLFRPQSAILPVLLTAIWLIAAFGAGIYAPAYYKSYYYEMGETQLHIHRGVFWIREQWMDRQKILLVTICHNPLTPLVRLSSLFLTTPGAHCLLLTLDTRRAEELAALLSKSGGDGL